MSFLIPVGDKLTQIESNLPNFYNISSNLYSFCETQVESHRKYASQ